MQQTQRIQQPTTEQPNYLTPVPLISNIRHIIFDLGGVLLNLDYSATERAFIDLGIPDFGVRYSQMQQDTTFDDWETGRLDRAGFYAAMQRAAAPTTLSEAQITEAWNAMLLDFPLRRLQLLQQLRGHYDLFLLSNTNEVHEEAFAERLRAHGIPGLAALFDRVYLSHRVGMRKPGEEVFRRILDENGLQPEHTLFIDDSPQHIETASRLGIQTIWLQPGMTIEDDVFKPKSGA